MKFHKKLGVFEACKKVREDFMHAENHGSVRSVIFHFSNIIFRSQSPFIPGTAPRKLYCQTVCA